MKAEDFLLNATANAYINDYDAFLFGINNQINKRIMTSMPVKVVRVTRNGEGAMAGFVDVQPMIREMTATGETLVGSVIFNLRYFRYQSGTTAFICDPQVGDIGLAVIAKHDVSNLDDVDNTEPVSPASFRTFSPADGFYFGGFWGNKTPKTFVHIDEDGKIVMTGNGGVTINASAGTTINGNVKVNGKVEVTDDVTASGISLKGHRHGGVEPGSSTSGTPV